MTTSARQLDRDIRRSLTRSLRRWNIYGGGPMRSPGKKSYDRVLPEGTYRIFPISSREAQHLGYQLTFSPGPRTTFYAGGKTVGVFSDPEEAAIAAAEHYAGAL